ncbi:MAG: cell division protein CrgA [Acidobacteria bacterium]|nr:cell division protein CrgA [Acidobacteriota bacterium]
MPERRKGGRVTPKAGSRPGARPSAPDTRGRYTPPIPREERVSPTWVPVLMFILLGLGVVTIVFNYLNLLPGDADNKYLLLGLVFITAGFITATNFH